MDIKSKSIKNKVIVSIIAFIICIISSALIMMSYPHLGEIINSRDYSKTYFESHNFASKLIESSYTLYYKSVNEKSGDSSKSPWDVLSDGTIDSENTDYKMTEEDIKNIFNSYFYHWSSEVEDKKTNLKYVAKKVDENINYTNITEDIKDEDYQCSIDVIFNENGDLSIKNATNFDSNLLRDSMNNIIRNQRIDGYTKLTTIKNMEFKYYVPKNLEAKDDVYYGIRKDVDVVYYKIVLIMIFVVIGGIILLGLITPFRVSRKIIGFNTFTTVPLEILLVILGAIFGLLAFLSAVIMKLTVQGEINMILAQVPLDMTFTSFQQYAVNYILWFIIIALALYYSVLLRHIFNYGFIKYLGDYTIIGRCINGIIQWVKNSVNHVITADLSSDKTKNIIKIIVINGGILAFIALFAPWEIRVIGIMIYSVAITVVAIKYVAKIKDQYMKLIDITNDIAHGNFDVKYEKDLGPFELYKDSIEKIHVGFKKAVEEEVKSEKIKTELISNVSHDLKTPLTSIITYVDLLRNTELSEEDKMRYLDVIDKKSDRLKTLIEDLLDMSKVTSGNVELNLENLNIVSLVKQAVVEFEDRFMENSLTIRKTFSSEKIMVNLDGERTYRVLENLISNIAKYSMKNSRVYLDVTEDNKAVKVKLINVSAEEMNFNSTDIMERFVRGDKSRNTEGSGLGLSIAKTFVELQGGRFEIEIEGDLFKVTMTFQK